MNKQQKIQYQSEIEKYLEDQGVYDIFENLMKNLIVNLPDNPIQFLIDKLQEPERKIIFLVGPPGSKIKEMSLELGNYLQYTSVSVGDLLRKEISKKQELGIEIENYTKQYTYVKDDIVTSIVKNHLSQQEKQKKNMATGIILEGFPKTRVQGLALQKAGIIPDAFIILNLEDKKIEEGCFNKLSNKNDENRDETYAINYDHIPEQSRKIYAKRYADEYSFNINQVKDIYQNFFFQVDADNSQEEIIEDMARLLKYKIQQDAPKRSQRILVVGPPGSGRTTLSKSLAQKYGFVYLSVNQLLKDQIAKKTEVGKTVQQYITNCKLVPDDIVIGLLSARIQQTDCQMQGYVLDGFPKTKKQLNSFESLNINPSLIVILEAADDLSFERYNSRKIDPHTGIIYSKNDQQSLRDKDLLNRLQFMVNENEENIQTRLNRWKEILKDIEKQYSQIQQKIVVNSNISTKNILEKASFHLENYQQQSGEQFIQS